MQERKATLKLVVDDRDVKRAEASVKRLEAAGSRTTGGRAGIAQDLQKHAAEASKAAKSTGDMAAATEKAATASVGLSAGLDAVAVGFAAFVATAGTAVVGLAALTKYSIDVTNAFSAVAIEVDKLSKVTGYSVETISALRQESQLAGETFDALQTPIVAFSKTVFEAANGSEKASQKLRLLGLDGRTAANDLDSAFAQTIKRIAEMPPGILRTNLAIAAFGDEGAKLIPILENFNGDLSVAIGRASEFGTLLSRDGVDAARDYDRAMQEVNAQLKGIAYTLGQELAPVFADTLRDFGEWLRTNKAEINDWGNVVVDSFRNAARWVQLLRASWAELKEFVATGDPVMQGWDRLNKQWKQDDDSRDFQKQVSEESRKLETRNRDFWKKLGFRDNYNGGGASGGGIGGGSGGGSLKSEFQLGAKAKAIVEAAQILGVSPLDLATIIRYETGGTYSPSQPGGKGGNYLGLIQFGPEERRRYGVNRNQSFRDQLLNSAVPYLQDRSARFGGTQGMDIIGLYKTINGGNPSVSINASDSRNPDGTPRTIGQHVAKMMATRDLVLKELFGGSTSNVPDLKDLDKWTQAINEMKRTSILDRFRPEGAVAVPGMEGSVIASRRQAMTPDQIEEFVRIAPGLIKAIESEVAASGLSGADADAEVIQRMIDAKNEVLAIDREMEEIGKRQLRIAEITGRQEEYIGMLVEKRKTDMQENLKAAETELEAQLRLFSNPEYRQNSEDTRVVQDRVALNQQIFDLEVAIATQGANAAERYRAAWLEAIYAVREANIQAAEDQIRAQVRIADQANLHVEQVRARVLEHLAEQKSLSEALADGIISAFDKMLGRMNKALGAVGEIPIIGDLLKFAQQQALSKITTGLLDKFLPGLGGAFDKTKNPVAAPIVEKIKTTNDLLGQLVRLAGGNPIAGGVGGTILGGFGIGGVGGTAPWNPGGGSFPAALGDGSTRPRVVGQSGNQGGGSILDLFSTKPGGIFAPRQNILTGKTSRAAGIAGGIGDLAAVAGGIIGGRWGNALSLAGTGASIGAAFGPWGAAIGAAIGAGAGILMGIFGGDPKRKQDKKENLPKLQAGFSDAIKQLNEILAGVRSFTLDPDTALSQATQVRNEIAGGFGIQFLSKKYKKQSRSLISAKLTEADGIIEQIKRAAEISRGAADRRQRIVAEFAGGVFLDPAFRRRNGLLGGAFTGRDTLPSLLAPGELVLNPMQQYRVRAQAGFDVFRGAGIPNYPDAAPTAALAGGGMAGRSLAMADDRPIHLTVVMQGDTFDDRARIYQESDSGKRVILKVVKEAKKANEI